MSLCRATSQFTGIAIQHDIRDHLSAKVLNCSSTSAIHSLVHTVDSVYSESYNSYYFTNYSNYHWLNTYFVPGP